MNRRGFFRALAVAVAALPTLPEVLAAIPAPAAEFVDISPALSSQWEIGMWENMRFVQTTMLVDSATRSPSRGSGT